MNVDLLIGAYDIVGKVGELVGVVTPTGALAGSIALATGSTIYQHLVDKKRNETMQLMIEEMRRGKWVEPPRFDPENLVMVTYRICSAAVEGAARTNLRLMCGLARGMIEQEKLCPSTFLSYAQILEGLRREEIILLATMFRLWHSPSYKHLSSRGEKPGEVKQQAIKELIPRVFVSEEHLEGTLTGLLRTGFVQLGRTFGELANFPVTPLLDELIAYVSLEDILNSEE